jgi:predicted dehydrogenase
MKRLKLGMVGGGQGAFIGGIHRIAARMDDRWEFVAGALSSNPERAAASATELGIARTYNSFEEMAVTEASIENGIDAVSIVTPNNMHAAPAIAFLNAGIHVICDKPLAATEEQANQIWEAVRASNAQFFLTHNYTAYPLVRQMKKLVQDGTLGKIRIVQVEYIQDWLTKEIHNRQSIWRTDPLQAGAGSIGDIGTHAFNILEFVTGLRTEALSAELHHFVPGRLVDDNAHIRLRLSDGARAQIWTSQVAVGHENDLRLRVYGEKGGLEWRQENPNEMRLSAFGAPTQIRTRGFGGDEGTRTPPGHPEGYLESFANLYTEIADAILASENLKNIPNIQSGLDGMWFIKACQESSAKAGSWVKR